MNTARTRSTLEWFAIAVGAAIIVIDIIWGIRK